MEKYDLIIVGAGPAGIFTAVELFRRGAHKKILMVEKGQSVEKRSCPIFSHILHYYTLYMKYYFLYFESFLTIH